MITVSARLFHSLMTRFVKKFSRWAQLVGDWAERHLLCSLIPWANLPLIYNIPQSLDQAPLIFA
ncbi:hypothetical protein BpHYR1_009442 [Brachionus plicatilis]|uniref:Uncharacterized protein n=1 Tax=Brachionus plicatilis TaxID=10195 RepID=A0A3M7QQY7_BRAPC|nr:hypothetical protein BpHYR1_009442 [Brachionus plicatilis]